MKNKNSLNHELNGLTDDTDENGNNNTQKSVKSNNPRKSVIQTNIPQLRFPEFEGEWEKKKLGEVAEKIQDGTHFSPQVFDKGDYLYITSKNVKNGYLELSNAQYISKESHESIYKRCDIKKGDVLITKDGTIGQTCVNELDKQFSLLSSVAFIRPKEQFSNYFIYQLLVSPKGQKEIDSQIAGQALKRVTLTKINNFEYFFPTLPEQTKIATFLTAVDEKIQALKKKHSLLEQYKKGVMQQLFCLNHGLEGLTDDTDENAHNGTQKSVKSFNPKNLRFRQKDGSDFPEWEVKKLGEVCENVKGNNLDTQSKKKLEVMTISSEFGFLRQSDKFSQIIAGNSLEKYTLLQKGEMSYNKGASKRFQYGCFYVLKKYEKVLVPNVYISFKFNENCSSYFFEYLFSTGFANKQLRGLISSSVRLDGLLNINKEEFYQMLIPLPSLAEQTKIANFLSALDEKINQTQQQIEKTEAWKKGLLQKMFV